MLASTQIYIYIYIHIYVWLLTPNLTSKGAGKLVTEMRDL